MLKLKLFLIDGSVAGAKSRQSPSLRHTNEKKNDKTMIKKHEHFLESLKISWLGVRICNFEFKFSFFSFATSFFSCSFVFDGFPLFFIDFHGFPGFQVPWARKMKKK